MRSFTDNSSRKWNLEVNVLSVKRVKEATGKLLTGIGDNNCALLMELHQDVSLLVDVLWCLCKGQAKANDVIDDPPEADNPLQATEKFAAGLGGDSLGNAAEALVGAITDFFSSQEQRDAINELMQKARATGEIVSQQVREQIAQIDPRQLATKYMATVSSSQESPELTPGATPLAN